MRTAAGYLTTTSVTAAARAFLGAGGYVTKIAIAADGKMFAGNDTYNLFTRAYNGSVWKTELVPGVTMTYANIIDRDVGIGAYGVDIYYGDSNIRYAVSGGRVIKTTDGTNYVNTGFTKLNSLGNNGQARTVNQTIAIDPINSNHVIVCTFDATVKFTRTTDGGATWTTISGITASTGDLDNGGAGMVTFDRSSAATGGKTSKIAIQSYGNGVWLTSDGGATFTFSTGSPTVCQDMQYTAGGILIATTATSAVRLSGGTWSACTGAASMKSVVPHPTIANNVWLVASGTIQVSTDAGANFSAESGIPIRVAPNIGWHAWTRQDYMANGMCRWNPQLPGLVFGDGISVWTMANPPTTIADNSYKPTWVSIGEGIESMVTPGIEISPLGTILISVHDRKGFRLTKSALTTQYPAKHISRPGAFGGGLGEVIRHSNGADYARDDPTFWATIHSEELTVSYDDGLTWTDKTGTNGYCGIVLVPAKNKLFYSSSNDIRPTWSGNAGDTWSNSNFGTAGNTAVAAGTKGQFDRYTLFRKNCCVDKTNGDIYWMHAGDDANSANSQAIEGLWKSADQGQNFTRLRALISLDDPEIQALAPGSQRSAAHGRDFYNCKLKMPPAVYGMTGHLFYTAGPLNNNTDPQINPLLFSIGGTSFARVGPASGGSALTEPTCFGFGRPLYGKTYPTIYAASKTTGYWRCTDFNPSNPGAATWQQITFTNTTGTSLYPDGCYDIAEDLQGFQNSLDFIVTYGGTTARLVTFKGDGLQVT